MRKSAQSLPQNTAPVSSLRNYWLEGLTVDSCGSNRGETHYGREVGIFVLVRHIHLKSTLSEIVICIFVINDNTENEKSQDNQE